MSQAVKNSTGKEPDIHSVRDRDRSRGRERDHSRGRSRARSSGRQEYEEPQIIVDLSEEQLVQGVNDKRKEKNKNCGCSCRCRHRGRSHGHSRNRSRGHSRGRSRGHSRGRSRGDSRGRSRGHSRDSSHERSRSLLRKAEELQNKIIKIFEEELKPKGHKKRRCRSSSSSSSSGSSLERRWRTIWHDRRSHHGRHPPHIRAPHPVGPFGGPPHFGPHHHEGPSSGAIRRPLHQRHGHKHTHHHHGHNIKREKKLRKLIQKRLKKISHEMGNGNRVPTSSSSSSSE